MYYLLGYREINLWHEGDSPQDSQVNTLSHFNSDVINRSHESDIQILLMNETLFVASWFSKKYENPQETQSILWDLNSPNSSHTQPDKKR